MSQLPLILPATPGILTNIDGTELGVQNPPCSVSP